MNKFSSSLAQTVYPEIICDDFKRAVLHGDGMHQTFYVDCQGLDIDGTEIFPSLRERVQYFPLKYYDGKPSNPQLPINPQPLVEASELDFGHCSQVGICKPYIYANQTVSFRNCLFFYFQYSLSHVLMVRKLPQWYRCNLGDSGTV